MNKPKFVHGDLVSVVDDTQLAIVLKSMRAREQSHQHMLMFESGRQQAWYDDDQLTLIKPNQLALLKRWKAKVEAEDKIHGDLDWIFKHGDEVLECKYGASVSALAACFGQTNLWGNHGEFFVYRRNALRTLAVAENHLKSGDKEGWLKACETVKRKLKDEKSITKN